MSDTFEVELDGDDVLIENDFGEMVPFTPDIGDDSDCIGCAYYGICDSEYSVCAGME